MLDPPGDSCRRTHQVIRHLRAGIAAGGIVCLIHAVHDDRCDATTVPRDLGGREEGRADANARNTEVGSLARSTGSERMDRDLHAKLCTDLSTHMHVYNITRHGESHFVNVQAEQPVRSFCWDMSSFSCKSSRH